MDMDFPKLLLPVQVLSSPCYLTSGKRTAAQVQSKCASYCSAMPSSVLLVLSPLRFIQCGGITQTTYDLFTQRYKGLFFQNFKILEHSLLQITSMISEACALKCSEQVTLLSLVFLEGLQGERGI